MNSTGAMNRKKGSELAMMDAFAIAEFLRDAICAIGEQGCGEISSISSYGAEKCFNLLIKKMKEGYGGNPWPGATDVDI